MHRASGSILLEPATVKLLKENQMKKGDVLAVAQIAGISGAKQTATLIPLCHNIVLDKVALNLSLTDASELSQRARSYARAGPASKWRH
ncbi:MAG: cyclic pyranopterin monophosphate synthase MoaC [Ignavibacteriales bacterium]|nr:cyclic pyranopterin monophosphate synthase MoaC [Ignavibacteriales bacterium]